MLKRVLARLFLPHQGSFFGCQCVLGCTHTTLLPSRAAWVTTLLAMETLRGTEGQCLARYVVDCAQCLIFVARVPAAARAFWWRLQFRGIINFHAAFIGFSKLVFQELSVIGNKGARSVAKLPPRHNTDLHAIISYFDICVQTHFARCVVKFLGHTFRHDHQLNPASSW